MNHFYNHSYFPCALLLPSQGIQGSTGPQGIQGPTGIFPDSLAIFTNSTPAITRLSPIPLGTNTVQNGTSIIHVTNSTNINLAPNGIYFISIDFEVVDPNQTFQLDLAAALNGTIIPNVRSISGSNTPGYVSASGSGIFSTSNYPNILTIINSSIGSSPVTYSLVRVSIFRLS